MCCGDFCCASWGSQIGCAGFGNIDAYASRGSQIAKTLTSFRVLPFGLQFGFRGSQMGCAGFGFATLTSRLALRASPSVKLIWLPKIRKKDPQGVLFRIGVARFELTTFCSQSRRSTRLSYTPKCSKYSKDCSKFK